MSVPDEAVVQLRIIASGWRRDLCMIYGSFGPHCLSLSCGAFIWQHSSSVQVPETGTVVLAATFPSVFLLIPRPSSLGQPQGFKVWCRTLPVQFLTHSKWVGVKDCSSVPQQEKNLRLRVYETGYRPSPPLFLKEVGTKILSFSWPSNSVSYDVFCDLKCN